MCFVSAEEMPVLALRQQTDTAHQPPGTHTSGGGLAGVMGPLLWRDSHPAAPSDHHRENRSIRGI